MCLWIYLHLCLLSLEGAVAPLELGLQLNYLDMVLGTKLWSSGSILSALNHWAVSSAPSCILKEYCITPLCVQEKRLMFWYWLVTSHFSRDPLEYNYCSKLISTIICFKKKNCEKCLTDVIETLTGHCHHMGPSQSSQTLRHLHSQLTSHGFLGKDYLSTLTGFTNECSPWLLLQTLVPGGVSGICFLFL